MIETVQLLTVREVARMLKLSTRQIWKLTKSGRLPVPLRLSRSVRWRAADLERFVACGADPERYAELAGAER